MTLTGTPFLGLVCLLAVGLLVATLVLWPRLGQGWKPLVVLARVGLVVGGNVAVLLVAAVALNDSFAFFADWTDLAGAMSPAQVHTRTGGVDPAAALRAPASPGDAAGAGGLGGVRQPGALPADRVVHYLVTGRSSGVRADVLVALPVGYQAPQNRSRRWPVIEAFGGYPSADTQWVGGMGLLQQMDALSAAGRLADAIVVEPTVEIPPGTDTECVNGPAGAVETWAAQDVPAWVAATFRTETGRAGWATLGLSTGGYCAAMTTLLHPHRFGAAIALGGYFRPDFSSTYVPFPTSGPSWRHYDLVRLATAAPPPVAVWVQTSHADQLSYQSTSQLIARARSPLSVTAQVLAHAGHRIQVFKDALPQALTWLGANVPGFRP